MCSFARITVPHTSHLSISIIWLLFGPVNIRVNVNLCWHKIKRPSLWRLAAGREFRLDLNYKAVGDVCTIHLKTESETMPLLFTHTEACLRRILLKAEKRQSQDAELGGKQKSTHDTWCIFMTSDEPRLCNQKYFNFGLHLIPPPHSKKPSSKLDCTFSSFPRNGKRMCGW